MINTELKTRSKFVVLRRKKKNSYKKISRRLTEIFQNQLNFQL
jgi:hypothetical protein